MTIQQAGQIVAQLKAAFPRQEVKPENVAAYVTFIADLDYAAASECVAGLIATLRFFPAISEIREAVARQRCGLPPAEVAWLEVEAAVRRFDGSSAGTWTFPDDYSHPIIGRAAQALGGVSVMHEASDLGFIHRDFVRTYSALAEREVRAAQVCVGGSGERVRIGAGR